MKHLGKMQAAIALAVVVGFLAGCYLVWFYPPADPGVRDVALLMLGALAGQFVAVVQWHFGSSAGSAQKTAAMLPEPVHTVTPAAVPPRKD